MILSRIQRGAIRTKFLIHKKFVLIGRSATNFYTQVKRPVGLTVLAAYTATIPLHTLQGTVALADGTEPPSTLSTISPYTRLSVDLTGITTVQLNQVHRGKSNVDIRLETETRIAADIAIKIAAEASRQQEAARQAELQAQQVVENTRILQSIPDPVTPPSPTFLGSVSDKIAEVAGHYNASSETIRLIQSVANCESHFNPLAFNSSGASGVFQFMPATWHGTQEGRAGKSPFDAEANIEAGVRKMLVEGDWNAWVCYHLVTHR